jgi:tetrahydromethanopterin S-methyltransferase subunit H
LFKFRREQKVLDVGGVKIGGQPGELPTVLIGSLFHVGHKIVEDRKTGTFDRRKAEHLIRAQEEISEKTGVPCMLDIAGENPVALIKYIEFVSEVTNAPFLINGPEMSTRISAARYAVESGLKDRAIYTSVNYTIGDREIEAIKETGLKAAIVQSFNPKNPRPEGMMSMLRQLLDSASKAGIEKPLILTSILDVPSIGFGAQGISLAKEEWGMPTGTAPIGVVGQWSRVEEFGQYAKKMCRAGASALVQAMGADFIIYGSAAKARDIFPVCAMIDAVIAYNARNSGISPLTKNQPLNRIF